ncbi:hypothetical protein D910_01618 [Dendroctonus ponderosae]|uniref:Uncharacterized protein n=1 Tax=Dendroctonus ponderosae TaxID=77166 RepID=U4TRY4_DENPD|nr:hypothetical protein D910_01618 [Dendroctonus ponderosae]
MCRTWMKTDEAGLKTEERKAGVTMNDYNHPSSTIYTQSSSYFTNPNMASMPATLSWQHSVGNMDVFDDSCDGLHMPNTTHLPQKGGQN